MKTQPSGLRSATIKKNATKCALLFSACLLQAGTMSSQTQTYGDSEGNKSMYFGTKTGILDSLAENPRSGKVDEKTKCAKYIRSGNQKFDNIKLNTFGKLTDVAKFATYTGIPPVLSMKVFTTAPVGTIIEIQLGKVGKDAYPLGINSKYQGRTTVTNSWELVQFKFSEIPKGSQTTTAQIDQITVLFNPNSSTKDTYYFDDLSGPPLVSEKTALVAPVTTK